LWAFRTELLRDARFRESRFSFCGELPWVVERRVARRESTRGRVVPGRHVVTPTLQEIRDAARRIAPFVHRTPVMSSSRIDRELGARVWFKCENLQKVGAFKARGATNAVRRLDEDAAGRGVITHSSGNHGAALAYAAGTRGVPCTVVMPETAPQVKVDAVRGYGAEIVFCGIGERQETCDRWIAERGSTLIHPYEHPDVVAGQATAALELLEQAGELDLVIAPVGGGGLLGGTTLAVAGVSPSTLVRGAEPEAVDDAYRSLAQGRRLPAVPDPRTRADGLLTGLGELAFRILREHRVRIVTVTEEAIVEAAWTLMSRLKIVVEPSAATVLAALHRLGPEIRNKRVGAILSGGNTDFGWL
jgi:threonine dehydratase